MKSQWISLSLKSKTDVLQKKKGIWNHTDRQAYIHIHTHTHTHTRKGSCDNDGSREWSDSAAKGETPRIFASTRSQEEARKDSPQELSEGAWLCCQLSIELLACITVREYISVVLSHPVCDTLLQQPQKNQYSIQGFHR